MDAKTKQLVKLAMRRYADRLPGDRLAQRARLKAHIEACTEQGKIAIVRSGMDCDCTSYTHVNHVPTPLSVLAFERDEDEHQSWLDGPESMYIAKPSDEPEYHNTIDLALEAYEDGHPSTIYYREA